jgi:hypothetical protein
MSATTLPVSTRDPLTRGAEANEAASPGFEQRWSAWQARGAAHDRAVRSRIRVAVPLLAALGAVLYAILG